MKKIAVLGSTGSIGTQTLEIVRQNEDLEVVALAAGSSVEKMEQQIREFSPKLAALWDEKAYKDLKERLADRDIRVNEVNSYCGSWLPGWRPGVDFRTVYSARPELGGGVHIDLIHEIDTLYWLFGMPDAVVRTFRNSSSLGIDAVDYANYCMSYPRFCASVVLNYYRRDYRRTLEIVCEDSTLMVDLARNMVRENGNVIFESSRTIADTYISQMEYFLQLIKSGSTTSFNTVADAVATLRMALG